MGKRIVLVLFLVLVCRIPAVHASEKMNPYVGDPIVYSGHTYQLLELQGYTWELAQTYCELLGGHLAALTTQEENEVCYQYISSSGYRSVFFGLQRDGDSWSWVTGEPFVNTFWNEGEPNGAASQENYGMFYGGHSSDQWNDGANGLTSFFLCEWDRELENDLFFTGFCGPSFGYGDHTYQLLELPRYTWDMAQRHCELLGGHLATLTTQEENDACYLYVSKNGYQSVLFGLQRDGDSWSWVTGEPFGYALWSNGEPNGASGENYGMFYGGSEPGKWNDGANGVCDLFLCEWDRDMETDLILPESDESVFTYGGHTYQLLDLPGASWERAQRRCEFLGGHLATLTTLDESNACYIYVSSGGSRDVVFGLQRDGDSWNWVTGEPFAFTYWSSGEPNGEETGENYGMFFHNSEIGKWNDGGAEWTTFLCEWDWELEAYPSFPGIGSSVSLDGHDYQVFEAAVGWKTASSMAAALGGHLVTIGSQEEQDFVEDLILGGEMDGYWMGGQYAAGTYEWVTGEPFTYANWGENQPDNGDGEPYVMMYRVKNPYDAKESFGFWNNLREAYSGIYGNQSMGFICEWDGWAEENSIGTYGGHCYEVFLGQVSWEKAEAICRELGGHLAAIQDANEDDYVHMLLRTYAPYASSAWLGGRAVLGQWQWITGEEFSYASFDEGEPNGSGPCLHKYLSNGKWDDTTSDNGIGAFVCEWDDLGDLEEPMLDFSGVSRTVYSPQEYARYTVDKLRLINYLCDKNNFLHVKYISDNDDSAFGQFEYYYSNFIRLNDGWREILSGSDSEEDAEQILTALLVDSDEEVEALSKAQSAHEAADIILKALTYCLDVVGCKAEQLEEVQKVIKSKDAQLILAEKGYDSLLSYVIDNVSEKTGTLLKNICDSSAFASALKDGLKHLNTGLDILEVFKKSFDAYVRYQGVSYSNDSYKSAMKYILEHSQSNQVRTAAATIYEAISDPNKAIREAIVNYAAEKMIDMGIDELTGPEFYEGVISFVENHPEVFDVSACNGVLSSIAEKLWIVEATKLGIQAGNFFSNLFFHTQDTVELKNTVRMCAYIGTELGRYVMELSSQALSDPEDMEVVQNLMYGLTLLADVRQRGEEALLELAKLLNDQTAVTCLGYAIEDIKGFRKEISILGEIQYIPHVVVYPDSGVFSGGKGSLEDPFLVSDARQLSYVTAYAGASFLQICDISGNGQAFSPLCSSAVPFTGTYDGNGYVISDMYLEASDACGLFAEVGQYGLIQNLRCRNIVSSCPSGRAGIIAGRVTGGTVRNCLVEYCTASGGTDAVYGAGAAAGDVEGGTIESCFSFRSTFSGHDVGGLAGGAVSAVIRNCAAVFVEAHGVSASGGILGSGDRTTLENCILAGNSVIDPSYSHGMDLGYNSSCSVLDFLQVPTESLFILPANLKQIRSEAFAGTSPEVIIVMPDAEEVEPDAFTGCRNLKAVLLLNERRIQKQ